MSKGGGQYVPLTNRMISGTYATTVAMKYAAQMQMMKNQMDAQIARAQYENLRNSLTGMAVHYQARPNLGYATSADAAVACSSTYSACLKEAKERPAQRSETRPVVLSLKTSPLFGYLRWRYDSPLKPLTDAFIRWAWRTHKGMRA